MSDKIKCLIVDDEPVAREIIISFAAKIPQLEVVAACKNVSEAMEELSKAKVDLLFLDINMPGISGLTFAKSLDTNIKVIFTTAYREYAVDGFDLQVLDYLLKPISFERFFQAVQRVITDKTASNGGLKQKEEVAHDFIFVRADRKMVKITFEKLRYVESLGDYVKLYQEDDVVVTRETISNIESKLPKQQFVRVHRSYVVAVSAIDSFTNEYVEVAKKSIPISRSYKEQVLEKLNANC